MNKGDHFVIVVTLTEELDLSKMRIGEYRDSIAILSSAQSILSGLWVYESEENTDSIRKVDVAFPLPHITDYLHFRIGGTTNSTLAASFLSVHMWKIADGQVIRAERDLQCFTLYSLNCPEKQFQLFVGAETLSDPDGITAWVDDLRNVTNMRTVGELDADVSTITQVPTFTLKRFRRG
jgi:hypothetical protein